MFEKILLSVIAVITAASLVFGVNNTLAQKKIIEDVNEISKRYSNEDVASEDDVTIAGEFEIKSTRQISDAYIGGDTSALSERDKETLDMAKAVIKEYITDGMTDCEKEEAIYKYLTSEMKFDSGLLTVIPQTSADSDNPFGVLKNHNAVCVGYATTFRLLMQMLGFDCMVVHNTDLTHTWNLIKLDGEWYHTDCYMDSEVSNYCNFNMNDDLCSQNHDWNRDFFPAANGLKYNYAVMNCEEIEDLYSIPEFVNGKINEDDIPDSFSCSFRNKIDKDSEIVARYICDTIAATLNNGEGEYYEFRWIAGEDGEYILWVCRNNYSGEYDYSEIPDDILEKANAAIEEQFPDYLTPSEEYDYGETDMYYYNTDGDITYAAG